MRSINLYYVYDNINEVAITSFIPQSNDLSAACNFRDYYINITEEERKQKKIENYKALDLVRFAQVDVNEDGEFIINDGNIHFNEVIRIPGNQIIDFIKDKMFELGIEDNLVED